LNPQFIVDNSQTSAWTSDDTSDSNPKDTSSWFVIDVGAVREMASFEIHWHLIDSTATSPSSYRVATSVDGVSFTSTVAYNSTCGHAMVTNVYLSPDQSLMKYAKVFDMVSCSSDERVAVKEVYFRQITAQVFPARPVSNATLWNSQPYLYYRWTFSAPAAVVITPDVVPSQIPAPGAGFCHATHVLNAPSYCLQNTAVDGGTDGQPQLGVCDGRATQKWSLDGSDRIKLLSHDVCLNRVSGVLGNGDELGFLACQASSDPNDK
jgi:hypothetical protein